VTLEVMSAERILGVNKEQSHRFVEARAARRQHRVIHPTGVRWIRCMDSRGDPNVILMDFPFGIGRSYQNLGGDFDLRSWPEFRKSVMETYLHLRRERRPVLFIIAKHYSKSDNEHLGCKGHGFNVASALDSNNRMKRDFEYVFHDDPEVATICAMIDTDGDGITLFGDGNRFFLDLATLADASEDDISRQLRDLYPLMSWRIFGDLFDLVTHNILRILYVRQYPRPRAEIEHRESILFIGQSPETLCINGNALVVSPFDPNFKHVVKVAARILLDNMAQGYCNGAMVTTVIPYSPIESRQDMTAAKRNAAKLHAEDIAGKAAEALNEIPRAMGRFQFLTGVANMDTLLIEPFN
jgi:hypothetical protein